MALTWKRGLPFQHGGSTLEGAAANRPAAAAATDTIYFATDTGVASYSDGATWSVVPYSDVAGSAVKSLNGGGGALTGDVILAAGTNVTLGQAGQTVTINATGGSGTGIGAVLFDSTLGADTATIDTGGGGIASGHDCLDIYILSRTSEAAALSTISVRLNNDSGANYDIVRVGTLNATVTGTNLRTQTAWLLTTAGDSAQAGCASLHHLRIVGYDQTTFHKAMVVNEGVADSAAASNTVQARSGRWRDTAAITRLAVTAGSGNLRAGSRLLVYGVT